MPYWKLKLARNMVRDRRVKRLLKNTGWRSLTVWECQLKSQAAQKLINKIAEN